MIKLPLDAGFRINLHQKDLNLALSGALALGPSPPGTALAQGLFNPCKGNGWGERCHSGLVLGLETMANHEVT